MNFIKEVASKVCIENASKVLMKIINKQSPVRAITKRVPLKKLSVNSQ